MCDHRVGLVNHCNLALKFYKPCHNWGFPFNCITKHCVSPPPVVLEMIDSYRTTNRLYFYMMVVLTSFVILTQLPSYRKEHCIVAKAVKSRFNFSPCLGTEKLGIIEPFSFSSSSGLGTVCCGIRLKCAVFVFVKRTALTQPQ